MLEALESLNSNKLRSGLTVLGIVIGVAAVIAMLAVGNGAQASITGSINNVGTNLLFVFSGARDNENVRNPRRVTLGDAAALLDHVCGAPRAGGRTGAPGERRGGLRRTNQEHHHRGRDRRPMGRCATSACSRVRSSVTIRTWGTPRWSSSAWMSRTSSLDIVMELIGETVRIEGQPFRIIGVLSSAGWGCVWLG